MKKIIGKISDTILHILKIIVSVLCAAMLLLMFVEVIRRKLFDKTWVWSDELIRYMLVYVSLLGGAAAYKVKAFVGFDLILGKLPPVPASILNLVNNIIVTVFSALVTVVTYMRCQMPSTLRQVSPTMRIPMVYLYGIIGVGMLLIFLFSLENYMELIPQLRTALRDKKHKRSELEGGSEV